MDADLQLNRLIPKKVIDSALISTALETVRCLRHLLSFRPEAHVEVISEPNGNGFASHSTEPAMIISVEGAA